MTQCRNGWYWKLGLASSLAVGGAILASSRDCALAQITPDATLGAERSVIIPIDGFPLDIIGGGATRGTNLFHSFRQFNVAEERGAYFLNPSDTIQNILARVTSNSRSEILGTLGVYNDTSVSSNPNLFLMNPNGIIFGPNASLDIGGSFVATTANVIQLGNTGLFSASEPTTSNLLKVNPSALFFNALASQAEIINRSTSESTVLGFSFNGLPDRTINGLQVLDGQSLLLVGGDVVLEGGNLRAAGGRIELGSVAGPSLVSLSPTEKGFSLGYQDVPTFGDIKLSRQAVVNASGEGGGDIQVQGRQVTLINGSQIEASTLGAEPGGTLNVTASELVEATGTDADGSSSGLFTQVYPGATGSGGNLTVETGQLILRDGAQVSASTFGEGLAGSLTVKARDLVEATGTDASGQVRSGLFIQVKPGVTGVGGNLTVETGQLILRDGAEISANTFGEGTASNLVVNATELVKLTGTGADGSSSSLFTQVYPGATGAGGNLTVQTGQLILQDGAQVSASTSGKGPSGSLIVKARDLVELTSSSLLTSAAKGATGAGGNLTVQTGQLILQDGAQVSASTFGKGPSGSLTVKARDLVEVIGTNVDGYPSSLSTLVAQVGATGAGGNLTVETGQLILQDGAQVAVSTFGKGPSGSLTVTASDSVELSGTDASGQLPSILSTSVAQLGATGAGGNLTVETGQLILQDGAKVSAGTFGEGASGSLTVKARDLVELTSSSLSTLVELGATGAGGNLTVETGQLILQDGAQVSAGTRGKGASGNLTVTTRDLVELTSSSLSTTVQPGATGAGGNLTVETGQLILQDGAKVSAGTFGERPSGSLTVKARDLIEATGTDASGQSSSGLFTSVELGGTGAGGNLTVETRQLILQDGAEVSASTFGEGNAGNLTVTASDVNLAGTSANGKASSSLSAQTQGTGDAGNLIITTDTLSVKDGAQVSASTFGKGPSGNITVNANVFEAINGGQLLATTEGDGRAGNITVNAAELLTLTNGSGLFANTFGQGNAGSISVQAKNISLNFGQLIAVTEGSGRAGKITVNATESFTLANGAGLFASTLGTGEAGDIFVQAKDISLARGFIFSTVESGAEGKGGNIDITTGSLALTDKSEVNASTFGQNDAGSIFMRTEDVSLANSSGVFSTVQPGAVGNGGDIDIQTKSLDLSGGSQLQAIVFREQGNLPGGQGEGGDIRVDATDSVSLSGVSPDGFSSGLLTSTEKGATGPAGSITVNTGAFRVADGAVVDALTANPDNAGKITINANTFEATGGGQVLTTTRSSGRAGDINLNIADSITISGSDPTFADRLAQFGEDIVNNQGPASGLFANTDPNSTGNGGDMSVETTNLNLTNGAQVSAQSQGRGRAGNISIDALQALNADNGEIIAASTEAGGGEIKVSANDIRLRNSSPITTSVFGGEGGGGNIKVTADTFIAFDDSDILANAKRGSGGNITINSPRFLAEGFGGATAVGRNPGDFSQFRGNGRVDVSASSEFGTSGTVAVVDSSFLENSLTLLSANFVSPEQVVAGSCLARRNGEQGSFTVTGTGGLPRSPYEAISGQYNVTGVQPIQGNEPVSQGSAEVENTAWKPGDPIQEAQGMVVTANGRTIIGTAPQLVALAKAQNLICHSDEGHYGKSSTQHR